MRSILLLLSLVLVVPAAAQPVMRAVHAPEFGDPDVLRVVEVPRPEPGRGELLVRVRAAGVNPVDAQIRAGQARTFAGGRHPYPLGFDVSGEVVAVGEGVGRFAVGDEIFALLDLRRGGGYAEYAIVREGEAARKPSGISHLEAASLPLVALTAWQALFEYANLEQGQSVLIHAGAGGVGSVAVQLARWKGARVIATASEPNHEFLRGLGADVVVDYRTERFEDAGRGVHVVLDPVGDETQLRSLDIMRDGGLLVSIVGLTQDPQEGHRSVSRRAMLVRPHAEQLQRIVELVEAGELQPIVSHVFPLHRAADAHRQSETGHTRGKIVLDLDLDLDLDIDLDR